ncbi:MAG: right-handed parallel beta-helix repeat-containing protein [Bryobacteraceae bacterium]
MPALFALSILPGSWAEAPVLPAGGVTDAAAQTRAVAAGSRIRIDGSGFSNGAASREAPSFDGLGGASVEVTDGAEKRIAPVFAVSPGQIEAQLPFELTASRVAVTVRNASGVSDPDWVDVLPAAPALFAKQVGGRLEAMAYHADGRTINGDSPAEPGEAILLFALGGGRVDPAAATGAAGGTGSDDNPYNYSAETVELSIGDQPAEVGFAGLMPGAYGVYQINGKVPESSGSGYLPVRLQIAGQISQLTAVMAVQAAAKGAEFYVSPGATEVGDGSRQKPWTLKAALAHPAALKPGDTIWLLGGNYATGTTTDRFESKLKGAPGRPIRVRAAAGERVVIQPGLLVQGEYAWYEGFEVRNDGFTDRLKDGGTTSIDVFAPYSKIINVTIHDNTLGIGLWTPAIGAEVYGCIIYNIGYSGQDRGHGHGIYTQNLDGTKLIHDNIIFNQFQIGIQAYGSSAAYVKGFDLRGNILFNNGLLNASNGRVDNILFGLGGPNIDRITVEDNYTYHTPSEGNGYSRIGWGFGEGPNGKATVRNNYWIGGQFSMEMSFWKDLTFTGNVFYSTAAQVYMNLAQAQDPKNYTIDNNTYYGNELFAVRPGGTTGFDGWKRGSGGDRTSKLIASRPKGVWTFLRPNRYEEGRAHLAVYNWDMKGQIDIDLSNIVKPGKSFEVRDAQNIVGPPVVSGVYRGGAVTIPMGARDIAMPQGNVPNIPKHTLPEFGAFVIVTRPE